MKKVVIILGLILAVAAAYWLAYGINPIKKIVGGSSTDENPDTSEKTTTDPGAISPGGSFKIPGTVQKDSYGFPMSIGSTGEYVKKMQSALNTRYGSELVVDGIFGQKTAKALSAHGFNPDAIYWAHYYKILGIKI